MLSVTERRGEMVGGGGGERNTERYRQRGGGVRLSSNTTKKKKERASVRQDCLSDDNLINKEGDGAQSLAQQDYSLSPPPPPPHTHTLFPSHTTRQSPPLLTKPFFHIISLVSPRINQASRHFSPPPWNKAVKNTG